LKSFDVLVSVYYMILALGGREILAWARCLDVMLVYVRGRPWFKGLRWCWIVMSYWEGHRRRVTSSWEMQIDTILQEGCHFPGTNYH
jgi:hypothetical protein